MAYLGPRKSPAYCKSVILDIYSPRFLFFVSRPKETHTRGNEEATLRIQNQSVLTATFRRCLLLIISDRRHTVVQEPDLTEENRLLGKRTQEPRAKITEIRLPLIGREENPRWMVSGFLGAYERFLGSLVPSLSFHEFRFPICPRSHSLEFSKEGRFG